MTSRILPLLPGVTPRTPPASFRELQVGEAVYRHSAAQFWAHLLDELCHDFPEGSVLELSVVSEELLHPSRLNPAHEFEIEAEKQLHGRDAFRLSSAMNALSLLGPPGDVHARVRCGGRNVFEGSLPPECADAETFFYLAAWMLQWAEVEPHDWSAPDIVGCIQAMNPGSRIRYEVTWDMSRTPVKEGLFRYRLTVWSLASKFIRS